MATSFVAAQGAAPVQWQFPEWQREYQAALFEPNPANLPQRVMVAKLALLKRLRAIFENKNAVLSLDESKERHQIETALSNLRWLMLVLG